MKKFMVMFVPDSGLYYDEVTGFHDGKSNPRIMQKAPIMLYTHKSRAEKARDSILKTRSEEFSDGHFVIIRIDVDFNEKE